MNALKNGFLIAFVALLSMAPPAFALSLEAPESVTTYVPFTVSVSIDNKSFTEMEVFMDSSEVASLVFVGSSTGIDFDSSKVVVASYKDPRFNLVFLGTAADTHAITVRTKSGNTVIEEMEKDVRVYAPAEQSDIAETETKIEEIRGEMNEKDTDLGLKYSNLESSVSSVSNDVSNLNSTVTELSYDSTSIQDSVEGLSDKVNSLSTGQNSLGSTVNSISGKVEGLQSETNKDALALTDLSVKVGKLERDVNSIIPGQDTGLFSGLVSFVGKSALPASVLIIIVIIAILALLA